MEVVNVCVSAGGHMTVSSYLVEQLDSPFAFGDGCSTEVDWQMHT